MTEPRRIAILGGGMGSLSTAYWLTSAPDWRERYSEITVYQVGWRLGGKGASGRGPQGRIEEHGLHVWLGFYDNAFRLMREVYAETSRGPAPSPGAAGPFRTWTDAFKHRPWVQMEERVDDGWKLWALTFPQDDRLPGEAPAAAEHSSWHYCERIISWLWGHATGEMPAEAYRGPGGRIRKWFHRLISSFRRAERVAKQAFDAAGLAALDEARSLAKELGSVHPHLHPPERHHVLAGHLERAVAHTRAQLSGTASSLGDDLRRALIVADLGASMLIGLLRDGAFHHGLEPLDVWDFREWLGRHNCSPAAINSAPVAALYDLAFAYQDGDSQKPQFAAGTATLGLLRLCLDYKGAIFWQMEAGMGDTVFTPLYLVLKARGVRFKFFHRVEELGLGDGNRQIDTITMSEQVKLRPGLEEYDPLQPVGELLCWPSEPLREQIEDGERLAGYNLESFWTDWPNARTFDLQRGRDFDDVVLGISVGALPFLTKQLMAADERWAAMVTGLQTVRTQASQLWFAPDTAALGWKSSTALFGSYVNPFSSGSDFSHLIPRERWQEPNLPQSLWYLCDAMPDAGEPFPPRTDAGFPRRAYEQVRANTRAYLGSAAPQLWPTAAPTPGDFRWEMLVDPSGQAGAERLNAQFFRANIDPSERYVLSVPHTTTLRLGQGESGFDNLFLAGDWTKVYLNAGCIESAATSGMLASNAMCGFPAIDDIAGRSSFEPRPGT